MKQKNPNGTFSVKGSQQFSRLRGNSKVFVPYTMFAFEMLDGTWGIYWQPNGGWPSDEFIYLYQGGDHVGTSYLVSCAIRDTVDPTTGFTGGKFYNPCIRNALPLFEKLPA